MPAQRAQERATLAWLPKATGGRAPSCVLVVSLDPALAAQTTAEIAGRCAVVVIATPTDLARAATRAGERIVVIVDTSLSAIDVPTFVGLAPILPADTSIVLWGVDERQHARLVSRYPAARAWVASGDSRTPGAFVLGLA